MARGTIIGLVALSGVMVAGQGARGAILFATAGLPVLGSPPVGLIDIVAPSAAWDEQQGVTITGLQMNMRPIAGLASDPGVANPGLVSGTVNSHFIHLGPNFGPWTPGLTSVTFDGPIVGVSYLWPELMGSDFLSLPGPVFDPSPLRACSPGLMGSHIRVNGATITFLSAEPMPNWAQIRVVTTAPAPATALVGLVGVMARRRRRA